jgi:hypothetical protein
MRDCISAVQRMIVSPNMRSVARAVIFFGLLSVFLSFAVFVPTHLHSVGEKPLQCEMCLSVKAAQGLAGGFFVCGFALAIVSFVSVFLREFKISLFWPSPLGRSPPLFPSFLLSGSV